MIDLIAQAAPPAEKPGDEGSRESVLVLLTLAKRGPMSQTRLQRCTGLDVDSVSQALRGLQHRRRVQRRQDGPGLHYEWEVVR